MTDWRHRARCRDLDPELFFPPQPGRPADAQLKAAKAVCAPCPVQRDCLNYALAHHEVGIWGGLSEDERQRIRQGRRTA